MTAVNGWHRGERIVRTKLGLDAVPSTADAWSWIYGEMPEQHSTFYTTRLPFIPVTILDEEGRPWGSVLAGKTGERGFVKHPKYNTLDVEARLWKGDPFHKAVKALQDKEGRGLIAGIGVELSTRRRNKFAGHVTRVGIHEQDLSMRLVANQAMGNCPKYITLRDMVPEPTANSVVVEDKPHLESADRLSEEAIAFVLASDTVFFGTTYAATEEESKLYPSHLGMNHRGGRPGFVRVKPSDGRTLILPDFSGNRIMTSLGNVEASPYASLTFISFTSGDILYITGKARNLAGLDAQAVMPMQDTLTEVYTTGYTLVHNALPARQKDANITPSPYSPPVKLLAEEATQTHLFSPDDKPSAQLTRISVHSPTLATFEWEASAPLRIEPGQAAILDFRPLLGERRYQHMSQQNPNLVNDDFMRTWTVSSAQVADGADSRRFALTIRHKQGGTVTGVLFTLLRKIQEAKPEILEDARDLELSVNLAGITGEFVLPELPEAPALRSKKRLLWIAGGIGITPYLAMLAAVASSPTSRLAYDITLLISTREPDVMVSLVDKALGPSKEWPGLKVHIFSSDLSPPSTDSTLPVARHQGRIQAGFFADNKQLLDRPDTEIYVCGPQQFEEGIFGVLGGLGVDVATIHREGFAY